MPRLNTLDGRVVQGQTTISVDGVVPADLVGLTANNPHWFDEATSDVLYQNNVGASFLQSYNVDSPLFTTRSPIGANLHAAGNGVWIAFLAAGGNKGIRTSIAGYGPFSTAGPGDVDESGYSAFVQNYQTGIGMRAYDPSGTLVLTWNVQLAGGYVIRCRSGIVAYPAVGNVWYLRDLTDGSELPIANQQVPVGQCVPLVFGSRTYVLEVSEQLTLREATGSQGWILTTDDTYNVDVCALDSDTIRVAYSATAGEGPTALRMVDLTVGTGETTLWTSASGSLVSSTGPTLNALPLPTSGVVGGSGSRELQSILRHPVVQAQDHILTEPWWRFFNRMALLNAQPINLATQVTGVLGPGNGGTGGTDAEIDGGNIVGIIPPEALVNVPNVGYWTLLSAGPPLNLEEIVAQAGSWSPLMSGPDEATSELVLDINGDCIPVWIAAGTQTIIPPLVDDGSGAPIALFIPVTDEAYT